MRKKLDTRFPASRIKKIMQADEDVGKIALAVPLLVSKALEQFLQDLCDRTYDITLRRGAKTISALHLKQSVQSFNVYDFLRDVVSKVPDLGGSDAGGEEKTVGKRRKAGDDEDNDSDEDTKRTKTTHEMGNGSSSVRGRGRGRGRPRGRGTRTIERDNAQSEKCEDDPDMSPQHEKPISNPEKLENGVEAKKLMENAEVGTDDANTATRNFDLNLEMDENGTAEGVKSEIAATEAAASASLAEPPEVKHDEYPGWSISDINKLAMDPIQLAQLNRRLDEEDEDYDEEG